MSNLAVPTTLLLNEYLLAPENYLLVATSESIRGFETSISGNRLKEVVAPMKIENGAETVSYDQNTDTVLYCNQTLGSLVAIESNGSSRTLIRWLGMRVRGLAVDWNSDLIYYIDEGSKSINVVSRDGQRRAAILVRTWILNLIDIVVDPESK